MAPARRAKAAAPAAATTTAGPNPDAIDGALDAMADRQDPPDEAEPRTPSTPTSSSALAINAGSRRRPSSRGHSRGSRVQLPTALQYPLVIVLSFCMSSLGYSLLTEWSKESIALVSRSLEDNEIAILAGWRMLELAICWFGTFDALDVAALNLLSHLPLVYLLTTFYNVSPATSTAALSIDVLSTLIPFSLLRPLSRAHAGDKTVPNREIIFDLPIAACTIALATGIYSIILVWALRLYLPQVLVLHFEGIPSLVPAYAASYASIVPISLILGVAARTLIFTPSAATEATEEDSHPDRFDPVEASLNDTFKHNFFGYRAKTKVVIARTAVAAAVTGINTYLHCVMTIGDVESAGSLAYAGVWTLAATLVGTALALVNVE